ncbi:hypothetical protein LVJ83_12605 [Uruburuella testudinis]|uniref:Uncharacterized protein n=1 Tax=Uruburuella testudinis TaxID=1282863 RepID=A0ABY4DRT2_9NEIS|nr:hypothetical protein [Uruburuella testudinis]UOO81739.1 hypothetical protein LVJ83_12605 [Uruburuella testudinis]
MAKILVVGHPDSDYQIIETLLHEVGMRPALPSKREKMSPLEIDAALLKATPNTSTNQSLQASNKITNRQLTVNAVWHGLAMDLFLGNIDQSLWGWADPQALYLLDYWQKMDESIHFALVYDHPHSILTHHQDLLDSDAIEQKLQEWIDYNEALLHFYSRNQERCLLVNSQQAKLSSSSYIQQVQLHIEAPWQNSIVKNSTLATQSKKLDKSLPFKPLGTTSPPDQLAHFLADFIIKSHPSVTQLYQELQASASLPLRKDSHLHADNQPAVLAWQAMVQQRRQLAEQTTAIQQNNTELTSIRQENNLLLNQLHTTQEAFESIHLTHKNTEDLLNTAVQEKNDTLKKINLLEQEKQQVLNKYKQLEQEKQQTLSQYKQLEQTQGRALQERENDNKQLLAQLHHTQEELERLFLENQRLNALPVYYGAAERIRSQLDYRLGAAMIQNSRNISGWLNMPFALLKEHRKPISSETGLPAISEYQDAYEAEKMQRHLSYQLGQTLLKHSRNPLLWLTAPWALSKTVREFRKQAKRSK